MTDNTILVEGNHDTWGPDRDNIETVKQTFIEYNKKVSDRDISEMYYTTNIKGCPVIVLGSEEDHTNATISQTQIDWFAAEMEKASKTGLPIFVFLHQSINGTHGLPYNWSKDESDPYDEGGQFIDRGRSYTTAVYYADEAEYRAACAALSELESREGRKSAVAIEPFKSFCTAEEYHQNYFRTHPEEFARELEESGRNAWKAGE